MSTQSLIWNSTALEGQLIKLCCSDESKPMHRVLETFHYFQNDDCTVEFENCGLISVSTISNSVFETGSS